jgi:hypothetical protein
MADQTLSNSTYTVTMNAPLDRIDIWDWLRTLPDAEYQRCAPPDHIAAGYSTTDDGRPMSINVEQVGPALVVQHYVGEITEKHHCRMVSTSDVYTEFGRTKIGVIWDLSVKPLGDQRCEFTNDVVALTTPEFLTAIEKQGVPFEQVAALYHAAISDHNKRETPLFAKSIERKAARQA